MKNKTASVVLDVGTTVYSATIEYVVTKVVSLEHILCKRVSDRSIKKLRIADVSTEQPEIVASQTSHIDALSEKDLKTAQDRLNVIKPLLHKPHRTKADVEQVALEHQKHRNTIYAWLRAYENSGLLSSLAPQTRSDSGTKKLTEAVEEIVTTSIEEHYLNRQKKSVTALYTEIKRQCRNAELEPPHVNTVRNRVNQLSDELKIRRRFSSKRAHEVTHMNKSSFPHADYPLSVVQIDHTLLDIILVDDEHRLPVQRPWITMAIDVFSRMVVGYYVSFDPPSATSVGACLAHSILPKDTWLAENDIDVPWPCWGVPRTVHADNAKEFRGKTLQLACEQYGITLEWRPVARPHFGAHIERLLGTFAKEIHNLPGTTFSNISQKDEYDSSKESALTLSEFEKWFSLLVTQSYHHRFHTGINMSPIKKYEEGVLGKGASKGIGLPARVKDEETLRLTFLPMVERTVQDYGIRIDNIYYYHDVLRVWINAKEESNSKLKRKFVFRRDPRDISKVWFFDPQVATYFPIPYRNLSLPVISVWEYNAALKRLKDEGREHIDEDVIFDAIEKMRVIENAAVKTTKKARKANERRKTSSKKALSATMPIVPEKQSNSEVIQQQDIDDDEIILPFDEMLERGSHG